ncbi:MAG: MtaA/CmuA family methyltransferase [Acidobacteria bacterium]|uniref:MtaA/CmuA family methyltransferase n=1 Tax=Candidatus Polarisedimenticola svalbardensis TaxID=2886004 RepID=A0A8J7CMP1_9BACT|nr:MtaA/CmuA family methyltransferase [Candidatus Polarisedimenticola svalbardensis]
MNLKERFMRRLEGKDVDMTPVGCTTTYGIVELMRKCGAERPAADTDPETMAALAIAGHTIAGFEWVKAMGWDIVPVSEVLGCTLGKPTIDHPYHIEEHPLADSLDGLAYPEGLFEKGRFPAFEEQFRILKDKLGDEVAVFGESEGPWTAACNLVGTETFMKWTMKSPDQVAKVLEVTAAVVIDVINWAFDQGADYYCIAEPSSSPALMSPKFWQKLVQPMLTDVVKKAKGPVVLHICANTDKLIPFMCQTGVAGISIEEKADLKAAVQVAHQYGVKVFGNVATATTLFMGSPEDCYQEAIKSLENGTDFLTPGCGVAPNAPLENVLQLVKARNAF